MVFEKTWNTSTKPAQYNSSTSVPYYKRPGCVCDDCGALCGFPLKDCPKGDHDSAKIKKNRDERLAKASTNGGSKSNNHEKKQRIISTKGKYKGRPMILNKKGVCVLDAKRDKESNAKDDTKDNKKAAKAHTAAVKKHLDACAAAHSNQEVAPAMDQTVRDAIDALNLT